MQSHMVSETVSKIWKLFWKLFGRNRKPSSKKPSSMSTPSLLDLVSATPEILGSATRPASAMGQIDSAPPAELTDAVSASPLEPFGDLLPVALMTKPPGCLIKR